MAEEKPKTKMEALREKFKVFGQPAISQRVLLRFSFAFLFADAILFAWLSATSSTRQISAETAS